MFFHVTCSIITLVDAQPWPAIVTMLDFGAGIGNPKVELDKLWLRYDLDGSGTINTSEEAAQLTTYILYQLNSNPHAISDPGHRQQIKEYLGHLQANDGVLSDICSQYENCGSDGSLSVYEAWFDGTILKEDAVGPLERRRRRLVSNLGSEVADEDIAKGGEGGGEEDPERAALAAEISQGNDSVVLQ